MRVTATDRQILAGIEDGLPLVPRYGVGGVAQFVMTNDQPQPLDDPVLEQRAQTCDQFLFGDAEPRRQVPIRRCRSLRSATGVSADRRRGPTTCSA